jgi:hypothetical protein
VNPPTPIPVSCRRLPTWIVTMSRSKTSGLWVAILTDSTAMATASDASLIPKLPIESRFFLLR